MLDRRGFLIGTTAAASMPALPVKAGASEPSIAQTPLDPWERKLREIEMFTRILRESRAALAALDTKPGLSESDRRNLQYLHSLTIDHCARVTQLIALESQWEAQVVMENAFGKSGRDLTGRLASLPHTCDRHM